MKKLTLVFATFSILFFAACEGPQGADGFDGQDGFDGENGIQGQVFEVDGINFAYNAADNLHEALITFDNFTSFEVLKEDAILVYRFEKTVSLNDGSEVDSWGLLPQNFFLNEGTIQYVPLHTLVDVEILIDGNFNLSSLNTDFTQDQIFRVVVIPNKLAASAKINTANIKAVFSLMGTTENDIIKIQN